MKNTFKIWIVLLMSILLLVSCGKSEENKVHKTKNNDTSSETSNIDTPNETKEEGSYEVNINGKKFKGENGGIWIIPGKTPDFSLGESKKFSVMINNVPPIGETWQPWKSSVLIQGKNLVTEDDEMLASEDDVIVTRVSKTKITFIGTFSSFFSGKVPVEGYIEAAEFANF